jgi:hypothetical protein
MAPPVINVGFDGNSAAEVLPLGPGSTTGQQYPFSPYVPVTFDPSQLPGLALWVRSDQLVTSASNAVPDNGIATQWGDLSGNGNHLFQLTGSSQPTWRQSLGPNGQPTMQFGNVTNSWVV